MRKHPWLPMMMCGLALAGSAMGQTTPPVEPVGFLNVTVPAQSDAVVSVPLRRPAVFQGKIFSISGSQVKLSATPSLPAGAVYALVVASGVKEGMIVRITAQSGAVVTVSLDAGDDFSGVATGANGDRVKIMPYWSPAALLPATAPVGTQILSFENGGAGVNLSSTKVYAHSGGDVWKNNSTGANASNLPLPFGAAFVLRNTSGAVLKFAIVGGVPAGKQRLKLATLAGDTPQDIRIGFGNPVPAALNNLGLGAMADGDQILGFNNAARGYNKAASLLLIMDGGVWKDQFSGKPVGSTFQFKPGFGYIFRKAATSTPSQSVWSGLPVYLSPQP